MGALTRIAGKYITLHYPLPLLHVQVTIGTNLSLLLNESLLYSSSSSDTSLGVILPSIVVPVIVILAVVVACVLLVVLIYRRRDKEMYPVADVTQMETKKSSGNQLSEYFCLSSDIMPNVDMWEVKASLVITIMFLEHCVYVSIR